MPVLASGTQSATVTTEHTLSSAFTTANRYKLMVDMSNMVAGDIVEIRVYQKVLSGSTEAVQILETFGHAQVEPVKEFGPFDSEHSIKFTLKQTDGTSRNFDWSVNTYVETLDRALTEAYATDGSAATGTQLLYMIWSLLAERSVSSTTLTAKKLDGSTTAMTFTLDSGTSPTSQTRAT